MIHINERNSIFFQRNIVPYNRRIIYYITYLNASRAIFRHPFMLDHKKLICFFLEKEGNPIPNSCSSSRFPSHLTPSGHPFISRRLNPRAVCRFICAASLTPRVPWRMMTSLRTSNARFIIFSTISERKTAFRSLRSARRR